MTALIATEEQLRREFQPYIDDGGMVQPNLNQGSLNGLLYTAEMMVILWQHGFCSQVDVLGFLDLVRKCQLKPGLLSRTISHAGGQEGPDDYIGIAAASPTSADAMVEYGKSHLWCFNNVDVGDRNPDGSVNWGSFFIRFPAVIAHMYYSSLGREPNFFLRLAWRISVLTCGLLHPEAQDNWILTWLLLHSAADRNYLNQWCAAIWLRRLRKHWPNGMTDVFTKYFGFAHPIAIYAKDL